MQSIEIFYIIFGKRKFAQPLHIKHSEMDIMIGVDDFLG